MTKNCPSNNLSDDRWSNFWLIKPKAGLTNSNAIIREISDLFIFS